MRKSFQRVIATLNLFQGKQSLTIFLLAAIFALTACDDSSSASSNEPDENAAAESSSSSVCKDCEDGDGSSSSKKVESSDNQSKDSSSDAKSNSSSSKKENTNNSSSSQKAGSSSSEFVFKLCEDGDTSSIVLAGKIYYNSCKNGQWNQDSIGEYVKPKVYPNMDSVFGSEFKAYGTYKDLRDNNVYKTTKYYEKFQQNGGTVIDSFTVMAQNLNYAEIMIDSTTKVFDDNKVEKRLREAEKQLAECAPEDLDKKLNAFQRARDLFEEQGGDNYAVQAERMLAAFGLATSLPANATSSP